jgi:hypothetical protein
MRRGVWGSPPPPKIRSFDKAEPNSLLRGIYIRNNVIRIWVSFICKLSGTPDWWATAPRSPFSLPSVLNCPKKKSWLRHCSCITLPVFKRQLWDQRLSSNFGRNMLLPRGGLRSTRGLGPTMTARGQSIDISIGMLPQTLIISRLDELPRLAARI